MFIIEKLGNKIKIKTMYQRAWVLDFKIILSGRSAPMPYSCVILVKLPILPKYHFLACKENIKSVLEKCCED